MLSLRAALFDLTTDRLTQYAKEITDEKRPTRKEELVQFLETRIGKQLPTLWHKLDDMDQLAVSETLYSSNTIFNTTQFKAKYGSVPPAINWSGGYHSKPPLLRFFLYGNSYGVTVPTELIGILKKFVPKPEPYRLKTLKALPEYFEQVRKRYRWQDGDTGITVQTRRGLYQVPRERPKVIPELESHRITSKQTENGAQQELLTVLRLTAANKIAVSDKTHRVSAATAKMLAGMLIDGDFYEIIEPKNKWEQEIGPIRAYSWPLLVQAAKLAATKGGKLALTKGGLDALNAPTHETIRTMWQRLVKTTLFDEFQRVDAIKGQTGRGAQMSAVEERRSTISEALSQMPVGEWIKLEELCRYMQAFGLLFEVSHNPYSLYLCDPNYGSLGYRGAGWDILEGRYILCFLFEYAATLGLIDVAYISPDDVIPDYHNLWGTDELRFLSRYDGLLYFRVNDLGAYCLGITNNYNQSVRKSRSKVSVMPSLQISVLEESPSPETTLLLDTYAEKEAPGVWRLARNKAIAAVESGHKITELKDFLEACDDQPIPETVEAFIKQADTGAKALRHAGTAIVVECDTKETADAIAKNHLTKSMCQRAGDKSLVVATHLEEKFRRAVNILGYGIPRV